MVTPPAGLQPRPTLPIVDKIGASAENPADAEFFFDFSRRVSSHSYLHPDGKSGDVSVKVGIAREVRPAASA